MRAVLLAAGFGTRLRPLTDRVPKCLVPIQGRPLIDFWFEQLDAAGVEAFLVNTHHLSEEVAAHVARSPWTSRVTIVHERELLGTAGTVLANRAFTGGGPVLVAHADNLCVCDFRAFLRAHEARPRPVALTMMTFVTDRPSSCGIVELDDRGVVVGFHEKVADPPGNLANGAVYVIDPEVIEYAASLGRPVVDLSTEVIPRFLGRIGTWLNTGIHRDIGTAESLAAAQHDALPATLLQSR